MRDQAAAIASAEQVVRHKPAWSWLGDQVRVRELTQDLACPRERDVGQAGGARQGDRRAGAEAGAAVPRLGTVPLPVARIVARGHIGAARPEPAARVLQARGRQARCSVCN